MNSAVPQSEVRWVAADSGQLLWAQWGADFALFHRPSGQTHFVNEATAFLLREALRQPANLLEITQALGARQGEVAREFVDHLHALLGRFEALGLVHRVTG